MKRTIAVVEWDDAWAGHTWKSLSDLTHEPLRVINTGFLLKEDKTGVSMARGIAENDDITGQFFIPRGVIRKIRKIKV